jgi:hypothetical protein
MKKPTYTLSIPQPCDERWDAMTPSEKGRFCGSCQKQVVDFSGLSDREVIQLIEQTSGKVCGRLHSSQVSRVFLIQEQQSNYPSKFSKLLLGLFWFIFGGQYESSAKSNTAFKEGLVNEWAEKSFERNSKENQDNPSDVIRGQVFNAHSKKPIAYATIQVGQDSLLRTQTDSLGYFMLKLPPERLSMVNTITVEHDGYQQFETRVTGDAISNGFFVKIALEESFSLFDGLVGTIIIERPLD